MASDTKRARGYCLSLAGAALGYACLLGVCAAVEINEGIQSLRVLKTPLGSASALIQGRIISLFIVAGFDILVAILSVAAVTFRVPRLTSLLTWAALINGVFSFLCVIVWYLGVRGSLWIVLGVAIPMVRVFASLANVQAAGGDGFEGRNYKTLGQVREDVLSGPGEMRRLGNWAVGMTVGTGALVFSLLCLFIAMLECAGFWNSRLYAPTTQGPNSCLIIHGVVLVVAGMAGLVGAVGTWKSVTSLATAFTVLALPLSLCVLIWWNITYSNDASLPAYNFWKANALVKDHWWFVATAPLGLWCYMALRRLQEKRLSGFEGPDETPESEEQSLLEDNI
ncbi:putative transmembrane protein [Toxoplasma gondii TgCatPRC2]|uniref:Transmembrane protein n=3 Tax=Toxoplasma gondii TaxID=5811 RepID=S8FBP1_TOXGM|nr:hypothetical protein TGME49_209810 [Toxoplasma gondii ME49]EPT32282.1 hypothetical protein TGME49_209810 [Toxoplasma gondii ME49]KFG34797.1 putative transmembrane protein [Toxoplasma gondii GAB2-2007-GAL-DOM2]KYK68633.1 putative transmembrane protein [Toxoplasma gondii TgCatPRC2]|eukprot:XP_002369730.1 hypothetical protein TGME49_209810 [Toxoplasma gondii ME49]